MSNIKYTREEIREMALDESRWVKCSQEHLDWLFQRNVKVSASPLGDCAPRLVSDSEDLPLSASPSVCSGNLVDEEQSA
jgi:hypothetical protein